MVVKVIAEIGSVHDGSFGNARKLIEAAAAAGADIVKFQTHIAEAESLLDAPSPGYFSSESRVAYFRRTGFSTSQWRDLCRCAQDNHVEFLSSPFSHQAVDLLEEIGVESYKIASGEVSNLPLLSYIAATGKPVYLSSGMSNWAELDAAVSVLREGGPLTVMQCASRYPCLPDKVGLNIIQDMRTRWDLPVGFSDHTNGPAAALAAVACGASVIEKHFAFSRLMYGSDAQHSMEPDEFAAFVRWLREVAIMQETPVDKDDLGDFLDMKRIFEKSVVTARDLPEGHRLTHSDLAFKKPGDGIPAAQAEELIGRALRHDVFADHKLNEEDLTQ
jgi:N-acetylneuraminate synthase